MSSTAARIGVRHRSQDKEAGLDREAILKKFEPNLNNILYILHDLQDTNPQRYLAKEDIEVCADYLNVPYSYVHSVASFYTMFSLKPRGKNIIRLCESPPCHLMGSRSLLDYLENLAQSGYWRYDKRRHIHAGTNELSWSLRCRAGHDAK